MSGRPSPPAGDPRPPLDLALELVDEAVLLVDPSLAVRWANAKAAVLWGTDVVGRPVDELLDPPTARDGESLRTGFRSDGSTFAARTRVQERDGHRFLLVRDATAEVETNHRLRLFHKALETMQVGVTIADRDRTILYANPAEAKMHGFALHELIGAKTSIFAPQHLRRPLDFERAVDQGSWKRESLNVRRDGSSFPVEILSDIVTDGDGEPQGVVTICQDITDRKRAESDLRKSEERFALAVQGANDGLWDWDLERGEIYYSPRWKLMLGEDEERVGTGIEEWLGRVHPEDLPGLRAALDQHLDGQTTHFEHEHRMEHADGTYRWVLNRGLAVRRGEGLPVRMAGSQTDITDRKVHDPLTGLPNRALFLDRLRGALGRARRFPQRRVAVLFIDLDRFKLVNDSFGHAVGDELLLRVAQRLERVLRPGDTVARLGGDEFTVLLEDVRASDGAVRVAERVHEELASPFTLRGHELFVTASVGIALSPERLVAGEDLLRDADTAMYRAKATGRARHQLFDSGMRLEAVEQLQLENDLRRALERGELELDYQPIVSIDERRTIGFEALVRWRHPSRGRLFPDQFISLAEETGLIHELGRWVMREACERLRSWQLELDRPLLLSVNVSPRQFTHADFVGEVLSLLESSGIGPHALELEITEGALVEDVETAIATIQTFREHGVRVCIDDFGTGYSSLSYLARLPVDKLKIDRAFIRELEVEGGKENLVATIIRMAADLGIEVVAEGVETEGQLARLRTLCCGLMQGYYFSRPVDAGAARAYLDRPS